MTELDAMDQFDRLSAAGFLQPHDPDGKPGAVFMEWYDGLKGYARDDVQDGISRLLQTRTERYWPTVGELRGCIASVTAGREKRGKCDTCLDTGWVEARPYRANAGHVYQGVTRCPGCGLPVPKDAPGAYQTPLTDRECAEWQKSQRPMRVITSREEMFARVRQVLGARVVPAVERERA
jgi:hypothetical protein